MKRTILAGLLGGTALMAWFVIVDGLLGFRRGTDMNRLADEREVHAFLSEHVPDPGRYVVNPEVAAGQPFPGSEPVFGVQFSGLGHEDAGREVLVGLLVMLLAPVVGAGLLTHASSSVLSRYASRLLFFSGVGVVVALFGFLSRYGIARYPTGAAVALSFHDLLAWFVAGLVVAWIVRPERGRGPAPA